MKIIFVRHGQTVFNKESRYQGHTDAELSELGRRQAERVADRLSGEKIDAVYSSDLSRAADTAERIAQPHNLEVKTDPELRECAFGDWEGLTVSEIRETYPDLYMNYRKDSVTFRAPGGERLEELRERTVRAIDRIAAGHPNDTVAIVTHGGPIRAFFCHALDADLKTFRKITLSNTGMTIFSRELNGQWLLQALNETCHLEDTPAADVNHDETSAVETRA